jgi:hypothetical protein
MALVVYCRRAVLNSESVQLKLSVDAGPGGDADELERLLLALRTDLLDLDVDAVEPARGGPAPDGTRSIEALAVGALIVRLARTPEAVGALARAVRAWLGPRPERRVRLELDGDVIELSGASDAERGRLVDAWIERHVHG